MGFWIPSRDFWLFKDFRDFIFEIWLLEVLLFWNLVLKSLNLPIHIKTSFYKKILQFNQIFHFMNEYFHLRRRIIQKTRDILNNFHTFLTFYIQIQMFHQSNKIYFHFLSLAIFSLLFDQRRPNHHQFIHGFRQKSPLFAFEKGPNIHFNFNCLLNKLQITQPTIERRLQKLFENLVVYNRDILLILHNFDQIGGQKQIDIEIVRNFLG